MAAYAIPAPIAPQVNDPLTTYSHAANLGGLLQERQLKAAQIDAERVKVQENQLELQDQQNLRKLYQDNNGDLQKVISAAPGAGVSPKTIQNLTDQYQKAQQVVAATDKVKLENSLAHGDRLAGRIDSVLQNTDPLARAAAWGQQRQAAIAAGDLDPNDASVPEQYPGDDHVAQVRSSLLTHKQLVEDGLKAQQQAASSAEQKNREIERPGLEAKATDQVRSSTAAQLESAAKDPAAYTRAYDAIKDPQLKSQFPDPATWSPATAKSVNRIGMTSEQRNQSDYQQQQDTIRNRQAETADRRADIAQQRADATDKRLDIIARNSNKFETTEVDKAINRHDKLQEQEAEKWRLVGEYEDGAAQEDKSSGLLSSKSSPEVVDPKTGKTVEMDDAHRAYFRKQADALRSEAIGLQKQAKQIRQRFNFGEFTPGSASSPPSTSPGVQAGAVVPPAASVTKPAPAASVQNPTPATVPGLISPGNIDLKNRPKVVNGDGTTSTVRTMTVEEDGHAILLPTVINGKIVSDDEAIKHYHQTGEHMGIFKTEKQADDYDRDLHNKMGWNGPPGSAQAKWQQGGAQQPKPQQKPAAAPALPKDFDAAIKTSGKWSVGQQFTTPDGKVHKIKGFTKSGRIVPEPES